MKSIISKELWALCILVAIGAAMLTWGSRISLDSGFYYSAVEAKTFFANLSGDEARAYLRNEFFDLAFIATYSFLFASLFRRFYGAYPRLSNLALVPGFFDLVETSTIIAILLGRLPGPPAWLGVMTCLKWTTGTLIVLAIASGWLKRRRLN